VGKNSKSTVAKKHTPKPPEQRVEAELVEKDYDPPAQDEAIDEANFFDEEAHENAQRFANSTGATTAAGALVQEAPPSSQMNPYVSQEEQGMEMRPAIVGPPPYGSPDPMTTAARLLPLHQHPFAQLEEGDSAAISPDYGEGYDGTLSGADTVTSRASGPQVPVSQQNVDATKGARDLAEAKGVNLTDVEGSGEDGKITKGDVQKHLDSLSGNSEEDSAGNPDEASREQLSDDNDNDNRQ
jgi:pyruvate/2-oxoglutarate dehydrogenase complex dihydrolipoamide acyltransferase (E2) component